MDTELDSIDVNGEDPFSSMNKAPQSVKSNA